jgi:hypothetical protein
MDRFFRPNPQRGRLTWAVVAAAVVAIVALAMLVTDVADTAEAVATLLVAPVFVVALYRGRTSGLITAAVAAVVYAWFRLLDGDGAGAAGVALLVMSRAGLYVLTAYAAPWLGDRLPALQVGDLMRRSRSTGAAFAGPDESVFRARELDLHGWVEAAGGDAAPADTMVAAPAYDHGDEADAGEELPLRRLWEEPLDPEVMTPPAGVPHLAAAGPPDEVRWDHPTVPQAVTGNGGDHGYEDQGAADHDHAGVAIDMAGGGPLPGHPAPWEDPAPPPGGGEWDDPAPAGGTWDDPPASGQGPWDDPPAGEGAWDDPPAGEGAWDDSAPPGEGAWEDAAPAGVGAWPDPQDPGVGAWEDPAPEGGGPWDDPAPDNGAWEEPQTPAALGFSDSPMTPSTPTGWIDDATSPLGDENIPVGFTGELFLPPELQDAPMAFDADLGVAPASPSTPVGNGSAGRPPGGGMPPLMHARRQGSPQPEIPEPDPAPPIAARRPPATPPPPEIGGPGSRRPFAPPERSPAPPPAPALAPSDGVDPETRLWNARFFRDRLTTERDRAQREGAPFSVVMIQVPDAPFQSLPYRRQVALLRELGHQFVQARVVDHLVHLPDGAQHWFAVVLGGSDRAEAHLVERRLRSAIGGYLRNRGLQVADVQSASLTSPDDDEAMATIWASLLGSRV